MTIEATEGLDGVSQAELELDSQIKFIEGMSSEDIQEALIKSALVKIDFDVPSWTLAAARLFLFDIYHRAERFNYHYDYLHNEIVNITAKYFYDLNYENIPIPIKLQLNSNVVINNPTLQLLKNIYGNNSLESDNNK